MLYSDCQNMFRDITGYIRSTGARILVADDPMNGYVGFCTEDQKVEWKIHFSTLLPRLMSDGPQALPKDWGKALQTTEGRASLVQSFVEDAKTHTITDPDYIAAIEKKWHDRVNDSSRTVTGGWRVKVEPGDDCQH